MRPLAYYSLTLDPIVLGSPTCIRAVSAAAALVDKATDIVLQHDIIVQVPHAVQEMMNTVKTKHLSVARLTKIELTLLSPNVTIKRCVVLNPATLLPLDSEQKEGGVGGQGHGHPLIFQLSTDDELFNFEHEHDCQSLVDMESNGINSIFDVALINPDAEYFVDGSRYWSKDKGHFLTGYAVVHNGKAVIQQSLPSSSSAQEAELKALAEACKLGKGQRVNIYTDSRYAFGVAHDFGTIWRARGFLTSAGKPIKNAKAVEELLESLHMPDQAAIVKVQAHTNNSDLLSKGNEAADAAAKDAAALPLMIVKPVLQPITETLLRAFQDQAPPQEQAEWEERGAAIGLGQLRHLNSKVCLPRALYPMMCALAHGKTHCSKGALSQLVLQTWHASGFQNAAAKYTEGCMTCAQHNPGKTKTPAKHTPKSYYPVQRLQVDYIQLPKVGMYQYVLVCTDLFSGWPEAFPVAKANADTTAKTLIAEVVCRYGVPETIESDRGTHFTQELLRNILKSLGIEQAFHTPDHPQSSGKVERLNGTLKLKIQKAMNETSLPWTQCLPLALYSVRTTPRGKDKLSPYEILFGNMPKTGLYFPQQLQKHYDNMTTYLAALHKQLERTHKLILSSIPDPNFLSGTHSLQPGDWVVTKIHNRSSLEPRYSQPVEVQLVTATSVKLQGRANWIHASHCKKVISPDDVASIDDVALGRVGVDVAPRGDDDSSSQGGSGQ
ncbi:uncharacterized protein LOC142664468 [Rhinoderma darwinii]|uniref:uncharacterized protein LOC142664468 n=1 Tax=Rhinoderma darwinii TaxID=43563 RepID=UPI003F6700ED